MAHPPPGLALIASARACAEHHRKQLGKLAADDTTINCLEKLAAALEGARESFLSMIAEAKLWETEVDGDEENGQMRVYVTHKLETGGQQLRELCEALGIKAGWDETIEDAIAREIASPPAAPAAAPATTNA